MKSGNRAFRLLPVKSWMATLTVSADQNSTPVRGKKLLFDDLFQRGLGCSDGTQDLARTCEIFLAQL